MKNREPGVQARRLRSQVPRKTVRHHLHRLSQLPAATAKHRGCPVGCASLAYGSCGTESPAWCKDHAKTWAREDRRTGLVCGPRPAPQLACGVAVVGHEAGQFQVDHGSGLPLQICDHETVANACVGLLDPAPAQSELHPSKVSAAGSGKRSTTVTERSAASVEVAHERWPPEPFRCRPSRDRAPAPALRGSVHLPGPGPPASGRGRQAASS